MIYALDDKGNRIQAKPNIKAKCPICGAGCIAKCGTIKVWHYAHEANFSCDSFSEGESEWHLQWKERFPEEQREVVIVRENEKHVADIKGNQFILELQHSHIKPSDIEIRENFYGKMVWLFDFTNKINSQFEIYSEEEDTGVFPSYDEELSVLGYAYKLGLFEFRFYRANKVYDKISRPLFFDIGGGSVIEVININSKGSGFGYLLSYSKFFEFVDGVKEEDEMSKIKIAVVKITKEHDVLEPALKALVDFRVNESCFFGWRLLKEPGQKAFLAPPQLICYWNGKRKYKPLIVFPKKLAELVSNQILADWEMTEG